MSVLHTAGLQIAVPGNVPVDFPTIRRLGYSYISPQACNGATRVGAEPIAPGSDLWNKGLRNLADYRDGAKTADLLFVPWAKQYGGDEAEVAAQAKACAAQIAWLRPDGFLLNPETEYKDDGRWRSRVFIDALKAELARLGVKLDSLAWGVQFLGGPSVPAGADVSPWTYSYDLTPWLELPGAVCIPEVYWAPDGGVDGADPGYSPLNSADQYLGKLKWPLDRFAFTFGWWNGLCASPERYFADVDRARARFAFKPGFLMYLADQASADVIERFGAGVAKGYALAAPDATPAPTPTPTPEEPAVTNDASTRNSAVAQITAEWLGRFGPAPLSRMACEHDIATSSDADWKEMREDVRAVLDGEFVVPPEVLAELDTLRKQLADTKTALTASQAETAAVKTELARKENERALLALKITRAQEALA